MNLGSTTDADSIIKNLDDAMQLILDNFEDDINTDACPDSDDLLDPTNTQSCSVANWWEKFKSDATDLKNFKETNENALMD